MTEPMWRKSTRSGGNGGNCVETAACTCPDGTVLVRDTKDKGRGPVLSFDRDSWTGFLVEIKRGTFDA